MHTYIPIRREVFHHNRELKLLTLKRAKSEQALLPIISKVFTFKLMTIGLLNFV